VQLQAALQRRQAELDRAHAEVTHFYTSIHYNIMIVFKI
jgi:hypothetical protein